MLVDYELNDEWLAALNECANSCGTIVVSVCAGHPHGVSGMSVGNNQSKYPSLAISCIFCTTAYILSEYFSSVPRTNLDIRLSRPREKHLYARLFIACNLAHNGKNQDRLAGWWAEVIRQFKVGARIVGEHFEAVGEFSSWCD